MLPQQDPQFYDMNLKSFNVPELGRGPLPFDAVDVQRAMKQEIQLGRKSEEHIERNVNDVCLFVALVG